MSDLKLIVLAAGKGTRLRPYTRDKPKPLVNVRPDETLVDTHIRNYRNIESLSELRFITGYESEAIENHIEPLEDDITCKYNPFFEKTPVISVWTACEIFRGSSFILINGDTYYRPGFLEAFDFEARNPQLAISENPDLTEDSMKVATESGLVRGLSKSSYWASNLESTGAAYFSRHASEAFATFVEERTREKSWRDGDKYWHDLLDEFNERVPIEATVVPNDWWHEIDTPDELEALKQYV